ncbi:hypothetical protein [Maridesulfovibrio ferrireducens]|uniref:hypothetical protein n=1 Tax=Maridesulfovibrio ferrireducens TaxID=246191 RepID=UPI001A208323|nr:hypothetical protein [Maridesulfovibrio ferrireducens]MBI9109794.1 hypothetical protein [Maridesulfovibrio ferrireducens]
MKRLLTVIATLLILGGCSSWHNSNIVDPAQRNKILAKDKAFCRQRAAQQVPIGAETDGAPPEPTTYQAEFSGNYAQANTFEKCMTGRGWYKK